MADVTCRQLKQSHFPFRPILGALGRREALAALVRSTPPSGGTRHGTRLVAQQGSTFPIPQTSYVLWEMGLVELLMHAASSRGVWTTSEQRLRLDRDTHIWRFFFVLLSPTQPLADPMPSYSPLPGHTRERDENPVRRLRIRQVVG